MADSDTAANPPLSQENVSMIQQIIIFEVVSGIGLGLFMLLAIMATHTLMRKGLRVSIGRRFLLAAIVILFLSSTTALSSTLAYGIKTIAFYGPGPVPLPILTNSDISVAIFYPVNRRLVYLASMINICSRVNYFISDLIVVWRAWVLSDRRIFRIILTMCVLMTLGCMITEVIITIRALVNPALSGAEHPVPDLVDLIMVASLITTNVVATSVVAQKTWIYRTEIKVHLAHTSGPRRIEKILILLVESGAIYCGLWILTLIGTFTDSSLKFGSIMATTVTYLSAIYPLAIILLVEQGQTDSMSIMGGSPAPIQSIRFALPPPRPISQSGHPHSIIQSIADHIHSRRHDEESGDVSRKDVELQLGRVREESESKREAPVDGGRAFESRQTKTY